jgi:hypothetical protein
MIETDTAHDTERVMPMGITIQWDDSEQTIVRMTFSGQWTLDELRSLGLQVILMIRSAPHPVYVISDFRSSDGLPPGVFWQARDLNQLRPANWAAGISISTDAMHKSLLDMFGAVYLAQRSERLFIVKTDDEACELVARLKQNHSVS